ncbi:MAG: DUF6894 family protein [Xanthobacteraceae bacterium]
MPNYTFELWDGYDPIGDEVGVILTDRADAYQYAQDVVRELMIGREAQTRTWRLDVYENRAERVFEIPFASLAETLDRPHPALRVAMEGFCDRSRSLRGAANAAQATMHELRPLGALSRRQPFLITNFGKRTIKGD